MFPALAAIMLIGCSAPQPVEPVPFGTAHDLPVIQGDKYTGVIFPKERGDHTLHLIGIQATHYWTPDPDLITRIEGKLGAALKSGISNPEALDQYARDDPSRAQFTKWALEAALETLDASTRQYVGFYATTESKRVLINVFPNEECDPLVDGWRRNFIGAISDGGFDFWHIQYDVNRGVFVEFDLS